MFSHYFPGDGEETEQPEPDPAGGIYPMWFDPIYVGMFYPRLSPRTLKWLRGKLTSLYRRFLPERAYLLFRVLSLLFGPGYGQAREVVRSVARNPASRSMKFWSETQVALTRDPHVAENFWRGATATFELASRSSLPRPEQQLLLELAYLAYKVRKQ